MCRQYNVILKYPQQVQSMHLFVHAVEELMISLDSDDYSVREDVGTFMATITATRAVDFPYTVTVGSVDGTAVGKKMDHMACMTMYIVSRKPAYILSHVQEYTHGITQSTYIRCNC